MSNQKIGVNTKVRSVVDSLCKLGFVLIVSFVFTVQSFAAVTDIYVENFNSNSNDWIVFSVSSNRDWHQSTSSDKTQGRSGSEGYVINNYSGDENSEDWLISPEFSLSSITSAKFSYWLYTEYSGSELDVLYSSDYIGSGNPNSANWTLLSDNVTLPDEWTKQSVDLSAINKNIYIAFRHTSGKGRDNASSISIDDFILSGNQTPLDGILSSSLSVLEFDYTAAGENSAVKSVEITSSKLKGDIEVKSVSDFKVSLDGNNWSNSINISNEVASPSNIYVRLSPTIEYVSGARGVVSVKAEGAASISIELKSAKSPYISDAQTLSHNETLDIVSWNIEWFGAPRKIRSNRPTFQEQLDAVSKEIIKLDADVYALQEVVVDDVNGDNLKTLVDELNRKVGSDIYIGIVGPRFSHDYNPNFSDFPAQRVCFVYNSTVVSKIEDLSMFSDLYNGPSTSKIEGYSGSVSSFWAGGRLPYMFKANISIGDVSETISFVNIHGKCCSDSHSRKLADAKFLMQALNRDYSTDNIVVLGDYNDFLQGSMTTGKTSPYASWFATKDNFDHMLTSSSNIDHISVSNELYDECSLLINNTYVGSVNISDHKPIMLRMKLNGTSHTTKQNQNIKFDPLNDVDFGVAPIELVATSDSGLPVVFDVVSGPAGIMGTILTVTGVGDVVVKASQPGNDSFNVAPNVIRRFVVNKNSTAISDNLENDFVIQPNPCADYLKIELSGTQIKYIYILSAQGVVLSEYKAVNDFLLNVEDYAQGVYFVKLLKGSNVTTRKFIVRH